MLLIAAFLRATALIVAGYFVWFAASKAAEDRLRTAGKIIAGWCAVFALVLVIAGITSAFVHPGFRGHGPGMMRGGMHGGMMGPRFLFRDRIPQDDGPKTETPPPAPAATPKS